MRLDLVSMLRGDAPSIAGGFAIRGRRALVVAQVALAVTVLAGAGLLIRSVLRLQAVDLGLAADRLVLLDLHMPPAKYAGRQQRAVFLDDVIGRLEAVPAISGATPVNVSPFTGQGWDVPRVTAEGQNADQAAANPSLNLESIHPNYFSTLDVSIVAGRAFTASDRDGAVEVAIVSEDVAAKLWPEQDAIGKRIKMGPITATGRWLEIVGVAAQTRYRAVANPPPTLYLPAAQFQMTATMLVVKSAAPLELLTSLAIERIRGVDSEVRVMRVAPFNEMLARPLARPRFNALLLALFGGAALLLSTVGLYAVMATYVRQREREIAVRLALGASAPAVRRFVLAEAVRLAGLGAALGVAGSIVTTRFLSGMLFEISPLDPWTIAGSAVLLIGAAAVACYVPVRRAVRADALAALRTQ
jgi:predicted permease